jgi:predicted Zn-dependent protease
MWVSLFSGFPRRHILERRLPSFARPLLLLSQPSMLYRRALPLAGRVLTAVAASLSTAAIVNCAGVSSASSHDGTLSPALLTSRLRGATAGATLDRIMSGARGTYIDQLLADRDSTIERWPDRVSEPLAVWIDSSSTLDGAQVGFPAAVRGAFNEWAATGIPLRFVYVSSPRDAAVRIRWTDHLNHKTGSTTWRTDRDGWLVSGDITLATHISDGHELDAHGMRAIALHEVGHALGLSHSADPLDIMAPLVRVDGLSGADRGTVRLLYTVPAGHVE